MKICDKINEKVNAKEVFYSFEFFPPKTHAGITNLYSRMDRMAALEPLFCDITWGTGGSTESLTIEISANAQKFSGLEMLMHLTCTNMEIDQIRKALDSAKEAGIQNILALRGDAPRGKENKGGFTHAIDLVKFIRQEYGDYFCIAVAGYPEGHPESKDMTSDIQYLKDKIDAGANFIISQLFYDAHVFLSFVDHCRAIGLTCPILPGIMPIQNYIGFSRMSAFCKHIPLRILNDIEPIKDNDEAIKAFGVQMAIEMCQTILQSSKHAVYGLHFYTLNLEKSVRLILDGLGLTDVSSNHKRELPWRPSTLSKRANETVRPIFWANRVKSYLHRTSSWDEFPNGRWGDNESPAFGDLSESHYMQAMNSIHSKQDQKHMWGEAPLIYEDIYETFTRYVMNAIKKLPWCDTPLHLETKSIQDVLTQINQNGFLTINSQPRVNGVSSSDPMFGWGGDNGKVYQKAYIECFVSPGHLKYLMQQIESMKSIQYVAVDVIGNTYTNCEKGTTAVTWGSFPNKEILQPTVVDTDSFLAWKDEAFSLWISMWASLYEEESASYGLIHEIHDTFFLVSIVDNNFVNGNIWDIFAQYTKPSSGEKVVANAGGTK